MIDKIIQFFKNKVVRRVSTVVFVVSVLSLAIGGITGEEMNAAIKALLQVLQDIGAVIAIILAWDPKTKELEDKDPTTTDK